MLSEFRQDLVSGDWVLISTERSKRFKEARKREKFYQPKKGCPFEDPKESGQKIVWGYPDEDNWKIMVIKNKYPAVKQGLCTPEYKRGLFNIHDGIGMHDVIIFKDHDKPLSDFSVTEAEDVIKVYKKRYKEIAKEDKCAKYIMIFNNFGHEAGTSIYHPHSQIISTPILPPDVSRSIYGAYKFYQKNRKRVYDVILEFEIKEKKRIIYENEHFIVFCPFVSHLPYEVRIFSKYSLAHFEQMPEELNNCLADALVTALKKIKKALDDPAYNFFIHTAPTEAVLDDIHKFYHWHIEILPKVSVLAGFELGTGIDINVVDPDQAAKKLREAEV